MWPAPANVFRVAFGSTAASFSSTGAKNGGLSEPPLRSTGPRKRERAAVSMPRIPGIARLVEESRRVVDQRPSSPSSGTIVVPAARAERSFRRTASRPPPMFPASRASVTDRKRGRQRSRRSVSSPGRRAAGRTAAARAPSASGTAPAARRRDAARSRRPSSCPARGAGAPARSMIAARSATSSWMLPCVGSRSLWLCPRRS